jgi:flagellar FliL protein
MTDIAEPPARKSRKRVMVVAFFAITTFIAGITWSGLVPVDRILGGGETSDDAATPQGTGKEVGENAIDLRTGLLRLEKIYVNVDGVRLDGTRHERVLGIELAIVYDVDVAEAREGVQGGGAEGEPLSGDKPFLRDMFIRYLSQLDETDLAGSAGLAEVKAELVKRARAVLGTEGVHDVLISDLILQ